jgi:hypothetical protein
MQALHKPGGAFRSLDDTLQIDSDLSRRASDYVGLHNDPNLSRCRPPHGSRKAIAAACEWMTGKQNQIDTVLVHPRRERRAGTTDKHGEAGAPGGGPEQIPRLAQLDLGFLAHGDVVRTGSAPAAASGLIRLRRQGHNRQLAARLGKFSRLPQRRLTGGAGLEKGENAPRRATRPRRHRMFAGFLVDEVEYGLSHVEKNVSANNEQ